MPNIQKRNFNKSPANSLVKDLEPIESKSAESFSDTTNSNQNHDMMIKLMKKQSDEKA